ncbi:Mov34/MPN/PAD-1 family protein, partial [Nitrolancea hollandica]
ILMGPSVPDPHTVVVTHASDAGPRAIQEPGMFHRDTAYCASILNDHYERFGVDYVGEWHSHTIPLHQPSSGDLATIAAIMHDPDYAFTAFGLLIVVHESEQMSSGIDVFGYVALRNVLVRVAVEITEGSKGEWAESP